jgi:signal transduction histidine kinase
MMSNPTKAVDRTTEIIQRTLTVARRAKAGGEPCQVNHVVQQTLDLVAHGLAGDKIALRKNFQADLPPVLANPRELSQVFLNLIDNARRAMASAQGQGTLTVTTVLVPNQPKPWVELRVTDDGPGVAPELQARIFEPFSTARQGSKGTGLSLAICHRMVTELGGTLTLESKVGQGATFIVRLPALEAMAS